MRLSPYSKQAIKWLAASLAFYAIALVVREVAWGQMLAGAGYVAAFVVLMIFSSFGTIALAGACYFALLAV